jgi:hypothetical protein
LSGTKDPMLEVLANANGKSDHRGPHHNKGKGNAPLLLHTLELNVDCTNVYGRQEIDANGRGGASPSSVGKKKKDKDAMRLPTKRCMVYVLTLLLTLSQPILVLSAVLLSRGRISRNKDDAGKISGILDEVRGIEESSCLTERKGTAGN